MTIRRPLFSYYGSKWRLARSGAYPPPLHDHIIEPFAGSAGYSLQWPERNVTLIDSNEVVCGIWDYLINAVPCEILALPLLEVDQSVHDLVWPCEEARNLAGFWCSLGNTYPCDHLSSWAARPKRGGWSRDLLEQMALAVTQIKHWRIIHGNYTDAPEGNATRFVDAPYEGAKGRKYPHGSERLDYGELGQWCVSQPGQLIACEAVGAKWLPFEPLARQRGCKGYSEEAIYLQGEQAGQLQLLEVS